MKNSTSSGPLEHAEAVGSQSREFAARLRRMVVSRSNSAILQVKGHELLDGTFETWDAEQFQGIGYAARPAEDEETEAIVGFVAGPGNPIVIATRNEATRITMAADLAAGETQLHNAVVLIRIKANGTVEIRTKAGLAKRLATVDDVQQVRDELHHHTHTAGTLTAPGGGGAVTGVTGQGPAVTSPTGTSVLTAE